MPLIIIPASHTIPSWSLPDFFSFFFCYFFVCSSISAFCYLGTSLRFRAVSSNWADSPPPAKVTYTLKLGFQRRWVKLYRVPNSSRVDCNSAYSKIDQWGFDLLVFWRKLRWFDEVVVGYLSDKEVGCCFPGPLGLIVIVLGSLIMFFFVSLVRFQLSLGPCFAPDTL